MEDWSPIRSDAAYKKFVRLANIMGRDPAPWDPVGWYRRSGHRYDRRFKTAFTKLSLDFADSLLIGDYQTYWAFDGLDESNFKRSVKRFLRRFGFGELETVYLLDNVEFDKKARSFVAELYRSFVPSSTSCIVLNNGLEPFNPAPGLAMLKAKQIQVLRDPRDVYVSGLNSKGLSNEDLRLLSADNKGVNKSFLSRLVWVLR